MEEGSLLAEALRYQNQQKQFSNTVVTSSLDLDKNVIVLDLYSLKLPTLDSDPVQRLLHVAKLATRCNQFLKRNILHNNNDTYNWHFGGDGPVFGVHVTEGIPHLRALCRYGPNVLDEWIAIDSMLQMSNNISNNAKNTTKTNYDDTEDFDIAITCWDVEDGQVILIQTAHILPDWVDQDPTDRHRYACWIHRGQIRLLQQPHITLQDALSHLHQHSYIAKPNNNSSTSTATTDQAIQLALEQFLEAARKQATLLQRTAIVVPRKVALLIRNRPDLIHTCIQSFCDTIDQPSLPDGLSTYEDWVWTTITISRTNYAMIRTMVSSPHWEQSDSIPPPLSSMEVKRYRRQCAVDATPHLKYALQLGVRLVTGLQALLSTKISHGDSTSSTSLVEQRAIYWSRVDRQYQESTGSTPLRSVSDNNSETPSTWLLEAIQQGPNDSKYNLEHLLKCPVYPEEYDNLTLLSHPETSIRQQLLQAQKRAASNSKRQKGQTKRHDDDEEFLMPRAEDVDDESWMILQDDDGDGTINKSEKLDSMLEQFQSFMIQPSGVEGVVSTPTSPLPTATATTKPTTTSTASRQSTPSSKRQRQPGEIRPRVFMNILHAVLKGTDLSFPSTDPYFFQEDYDLLQEEEEDDENDDDDTMGEEDEGMKNLMNAMDDELQGKSTSRDFNSAVDVEEATINEDQQVKEGTHVLSNLLQSLEAGLGTPGPVPNMLREMDDANAESTYGKK